VLGLIGLGAGGVAVFVTNLEAGPVALIAAGLLLLLIGMGGRMPSRLKVGDNEAEWLEAVGQAFDSVIDAVPPENLPKVEEAISELSIVAPRISWRARERVARESILLSRLHSSVTRLGLSIGNPIFVDGARPDAVVLGPGGQKLWVITYDSHIRGWQLAASRQLLDQIKSSDPAFVGILLLAFAERNQPEIMETLEGMVRVVTVSKGEEPVELDEALVEIFSM